MRTCIVLWLLALIIIICKIHTKTKHKTNLTIIASRRSSSSTGLDDLELVGVGGNDDQPLLVCGLENALGPNGLARPQLAFRISTTAIIVRLKVVQCWNKSKQNAYSSFYRFICTSECAF